MNRMIWRQLEVAMQEHGRHTRMAKQWFDEIQRLNGVIKESRRAEVEEPFDRDYRSASEVDDIPDYENFSQADAGY